MAKQLFRRYIWLIDTIRSANGITFEEINRKWMYSSLNDDGEELPKRTFFQHIEAIRDEFDIDIVCDRKAGYQYRIENEDNAYGSIKSAMVDALIMNQSMRETPALKERVLENRKVAENNTAIIFRAIAQNRVLKVKYHDEGAAESIAKGQIAIGTPVEHLFEYEPYGMVYVDDYAVSWIVVGKIRSNGLIGIFQLRKLLDIELLEEVFVYPDGFDLKEYVNHFTNDFEFAKMDSDIAHCSQTGKTMISDDGCLLSLAVESGLAFG